MSVRFRASFRLLSEDDFWFVWPGDVCPTQDRGWFWAYAGVEAWHGPYLTEQEALDAGAAYLAARIAA